MSKIMFTNNTPTLNEYIQLTNPCQSVTSKLLWPFQEDVTRFDFETTDEDSSKSLI